MMQELSGPANNRDIPFSDDDFQALAALARREFGLNLAHSKKPLVYSRLSRRLKARNVCGFPEYMSLLDKKDENAERLELISALTTNVTSFFREDHHFQMLRDDCLPACAERANKGKRVRFWSAGCSSGQEPYCIAMTLLDAMPNALTQDVRILATDIDPQIVSKARAGVYPKDDCDTIPANLRSAYVAKHPEDPDQMTMGPEVRKLISFAELNLIAQWPFHGPFDAIFCRNVAIYFDQETQQRLWQRFCDMLAPNGFLFIGHSERVTGPALETLKGVGITSYRKTASPLGAAPQ